MSSEDQTSDDENIESATCGQKCGRGLPGGLCENACTLTAGHAGSHNCGQDHG